MALIKCTKCGHSVSDKAVKCPKCGCLLKNESEQAVGSAVADTGKQQRNGNVSTPNRSEKLPKSSNSRKWIVAVAVVAVLALAGGGGAWFFLRETENKYTKLGNEAYSRGEYAEAVEWYTEALPDEEAMYKLGVCYAKGEGVPQSYKDAVGLWEDAAMFGYADAQYAMGVCCLQGQGVPQSKDEALQWLEKAASQGHKKAKELLDSL